MRRPRKRRISIRHTPVTSVKNHSDLSRFAADRHNASTLNSHGHDQNETDRNATKYSRWEQRLAAETWNINNRNLVKSLPTTFIGCVTASVLLTKFTDNGWWLSIIIPTGLFYIVLLLIALSAMIKAWVDTLFKKK